MKLRRREFFALAAPFIISTPGVHPLPEVDVADYCERFFAMGASTTRLLHGEEALLEARSLSAQEVADWFRIPVELLNEKDTVHTFWGKNPPSP